MYVAKKTRLQTQLVSQNLIFRCIELKSSEILILVHIYCFKTKVKDAELLSLLSKARSAFCTTDRTFSTQSP